MKIIRWFVVVSLLCIVSLSAKTPSRAEWSLYPSYGRYLCRLSPSYKHALFFKAATNRKVVALTFDDGPLSRTAGLLRFLKHRRVPATFFLLAPQINRHNARLYDDPLFTVGLHSYHHINYRKASRKKTRRELDRALKHMRRHGITPDYFRPPYGMVSGTLLRELRARNLQGVLWSLDTRDWSGRRGARFRRAVLRSLSPGSVLLMHDQSVSLRDLGSLIDGIYAKGYKIVPLGELMRSGSRYPCE
jgi:peptidoglycan/xylan/chitin deacetylase (PgdA/CDA1 family)